MNIRQLVRRTASSITVGAVAASVFALTVSAGSAAGLPNATLSSDGSVPPAVAQSASQFVGAKSFAGRGAPVFAGAATAFAGGPAPSGLNDPGSVIGADGRFRIFGTTSFPYRAIARITFKKSPTSGLFGCTGWFISKDTVATAGHCVNKGSGGVAGFYDASTYTITPGQNGATTPYGSCTARLLYTVTGWANNGDTNYDYAAIKLNCNIGSTVGWFGYYWQTATLTGTFATVTGYPCDKPNGTLWSMSGTIASTQDRKVFYPMDTFGCQSGSPVWRIHPTFGHAGMAVHTNGGTSNNAGTRITQAVANNFNAWRNAP